MSWTCGICDSKGIIQPIKLPLEALNLMIGHPSSTSGESDIGIEVSFCDLHWEIAQNLVENYNSNPIVQCAAKNVEFIDSAFGSDARRLKGEIRDARKTTPETNHPFADIIKNDNVRAKIVLWTLNAVGATDYNNQQQLSEDFSETLQKEGITTIQLPTSEPGDVLAGIPKGDSVYRVVFYVYKFDYKHHNVESSVNETRYRVPTPDAIKSSWKHHELGFNDFFAFQWVDDPNWYVTPYTWLNGNDWLVLETRENGFFSSEELQFTPHPVIEDLPSLVSGEKTHDDIVKLRKWESIDQTGIVRKIRENYPWLL